MGKLCAEISPVKKTNRIYKKKIKNKLVSVYTLKKMRNILSQQLSKNNEVKNRIESISSLIKSERERMDKMILDIETRRKMIMYSQSYLDVKYRDKKLFVSQDAQCIDDINESDIIQEINNKYTLILESIFTYFSFSVDPEKKLAKFGDSSFNLDIDQFDSEHEQILDILCVFIRSVCVSLQVDISAKRMRRPVLTLSEKKLFISNCLLCIVRRYNLRSFSIDGNKSFSIENGNKLERNKRIGREL